MIDFPVSPALNDLYTFQGRTWIWNGSGWRLLASLPPPPGLSLYLASLFV